jgi:CheY-like chemotaxis protein
VSEPRRILVVDDNAELRENLVECLELDGYEVAAAADGHRALALLALEPLPHVVIVDMMMPGLSGLELVARLRAEPRLAPLRLVLATGVTPLRQTLPVDAVLQKPFGVEQLRAVLERLLVACPAP